MSWKAKAYIATIIATGLLCLAASLTRWQSWELLRFATYLVVSLACSGLKVSLPGIKGTLSVNFIFVLLGIAELTWPETVLIGVGSFTAQYLWRARENRQAIKCLFNIGNAALAITASCFVFHWHTLRDDGLT